MRRLLCRAECHWPPYPVRRVQKASASIPFWAAIICLAPTRSLGTRARDSPASRRGSSQAVPAIGPEPARVYATNPDRSSYCSVCCGTAFQGGRFLVLNLAQPRESSAIRAGRLQNAGSSITAPVRFPAPGTWPVRVTQILVPSGELAMPFNRRFPNGRPSARRTLRRATTEPSWRM